MNEFAVYFCTCPTIEEARRIASQLLEQDLAACVNILPQIESMYRWQGEICNEPEVLLVIKSRTSLSKQLQGAITSMHPYDVPEVIALDISDGLPEYLQWVANETLSSEKSE